MYGPTSSVCVSWLYKACAHVVNDGEYISVLMLACLACSVPRTSCSLCGSKKTYRGAVVQV
jgi:hypothetical protein